MPDEKKEEGKIVLNGDEITEDQVREKLKGCIQTDSVTVSVAENRQIRQFEGNKYMESITFDISGLTPFLNSLEVDEPTRRKLSAMALGLLTTRINQMCNFMKASIHAQMEIDKIPNIDYREGEKADG